MQDKYTSVRQERMSQQTVSPYSSKAKQSMVSKRSHLPDDSQGTNTNALASPHNVLSNITTDGFNGKLEEIEGRRMRSKDKSKGKATNVTTPGGLRRNAKSLMDVDGE